MKCLPHTQTHKREVQVDVAKLSASLAKAFIMVLVLCYYYSFISNFKSSVVLRLLCVFFFFAFHAPLFLHPSFFLFFSLLASLCLQPPSSCIPWCVRVIHFFPFLRAGDGLTPALVDGATLHSPLSPSICFFIQLFFFSFFPLSNALF